VKTVLPSGRQKPPSQWPTTFAPTIGEPVASSTLPRTATAAATPTALGGYGGVVVSLPLFLLGLYFLRHAGRDYGKDYD